MRGRKAIFRHHVLEMCVCLTDAVSGGVSTFGAVGGVVQRGVLTLVVGWDLWRRPPDPIEAIPLGELVPAAQPPLKVTVRRCIAIRGKRQR